MWTKHFYYFQGLRALKCHRTKRSNRVNYRFRWPLQKTFSSSTPLPPGFPGSLTPPPARISRIPSSGGCGFFLEQPINNNDNNNNNNNNNYYYYYYNNNNNIMMMMMMMITITMWIQYFKHNVHLKKASSWVSTFYRPWWKQIRDQPS